MTVVARALLVAGALLVALVLPVLLVLAVLLVLLALRGRTTSCSKNPLSLFPLKPLLLILR